MVEASPLSKLLDSIHNQEKDPEELSIPEEIKKRLYSLHSAMVMFRYPHQVAGVQWLWKMHHNPYGGALLADDMGLGKTVQICAYLQCIKNLGVLDSCLIIVPKSVITVWKESFHNWTGVDTVRLSLVDLPLFLFHSIPTKDKDEIRENLHNQFSVVLTTYGTLKKNMGFFFSLWSDTDKKQWDYIILDEGHKVAL